MRRAFVRVLGERGVTVHLNAEVDLVGAGRVRTSDGKTTEADEVVWVTRASGAPWLRETGLALDESGFIRVTDTLQTESDQNVFAAGDIANMVNHPREKAGVFAVRQGPPLAANLRRAVEGSSLEPYRPQKNWLALISTGDKYAVASRGALHVEGPWAWRWKDWIDRRFMRKFNELPDMAGQGGGEQEPMRCGGCAAKVGPVTLARALGRLDPGAGPRDDAAIIETHGNELP